MIAKTVKYVDYKGTEREEEHFFNLTKAEVSKMETSIDGGLSALLKNIVAAKDIKLMYEQFDLFLKKSYGVLSADGKKFIKNEENWLEFTQTEAYSIIFMEISTSADAAAKFVNGVLPQKEELTI